MLLTLMVSLSGNGQTVGLVLSGGGPRGVTHVGLLKALEEANIPIDYISGTSMGAIIGGLYASGYSPEQIEQLITSEELNKWLSTQTTGANTAYYKKPPGNASWQLFRITYETELKAKLPTNIVSPYQLDFGFMELFSGASAAANYNFDSLYIPFRCVASDVEASQMVVLNKGQLEKAVRASMTFPFYFKPVRMDDRLMFDGGMYNNFPVDVMSQSFQPDIVIGCKAASNFGPPDEDDIISQIQSMLMANTNYEINPDSGILITPNLWSVNLTDFSNTRAFIDSGYISTKRQIDRIKQMVERRETVYEKTKKRELFRSKIPTPKIWDIRSEGISATKQRYIDRLIKKEALLNELNRDGISSTEVFNLLREKYFDILSDEMVASVYPEIIHSDKGYVVNFQIKPTNTLEGEIGGLVSSQAINEIFLQLQYNTWGRNALRIMGNTYLGRFHNSGYFSARFDIPTRLPLSFLLSYSLNGWNYFNTKTYFFADENPSFLIRRENFWTFEAGVPVNKSALLKAQFQTGQLRDEYYQENQFTRLDTADLTYFEFYSPGLIYEMNKLNRKQFASSGSLVRLCGRFISGQEENIPGSTSSDTTTVYKYHNWALARFIYDGYFNLSRKFHLGIYGQAAYSEYQEFNNYVSTVMAAPSFEPLPESQTLFLPQFRAFTFFGFGMKGILTPIKNLDLRLEAYVFQPYREILKTPENKAELGDPFDVRYYIFSGRFVYHAPIGPISVGINYFEKMEEPWLFNVQLGYYIFNRKAYN